jgi:hypothetical protein
VWRRHRATSATLWHVTEYTDLYSFLFGSILTDFDRWWCQVKMATDGHVYGTPGRSYCTIMLYMCMTDTLCACFELNWNSRDRSSPIYFNRLWPFAIHLEDMYIWNPVSLHGSPSCAYGASRLYICITGALCPYCVWIWTSWALLDHFRDNGPVPWDETYVKKKNSSVELDQANQSHRALKLSI